MHHIKIRALNSLAPRNTRCHITCFGAQGDKVSRLVNRMASTMLKKRSVSCLKNVLYQRMLFETPILKLCLLVPLRVFSFKESTVDAFAVRGVRSRKNMTGYNVLSQNWYLLGVTRIKPRPQNRILVPLRVFFLNFRRAPPSFLYGSPPPGLKCLKC